MMASDQRQTPQTLRRRICLGLCALCCAGSVSAAAIVERVWPSYTVGVVPQFPAAEIQRVWAPILERVGQAADEIQAQVSHWGEPSTSETRPHSVASYVAFRVGSH